MPTYTVRCRVDAYVDYLDVRLRQLELAIRCAYVGVKSFGFEYEIREAASRRLVVAAKSVQVFYDYAAKRSLPCPPEMRERLETFEGRPLGRTRGEP